MKPGIQPILPNNINRPGMPMRRCGVDKLNIIPRKINTKPIQPNINNQPPMFPQQNSNINMVNNNVMSNNFNNNINPNFNNQPNIPPQWKDFY